jgi:hypothetical protein
MFGLPRSWSRRPMSEDGPASRSETPPAATDESIEALAARWLEAERTATEVGNANNTEERARQASAAYDARVSTASPEELLLAWHAAEAAAAEAEMGSRAWAEAREVAELLRVEYLAARS